MSTTVYALQVVESNHAEDAFWTLDGAAFATEAQRDMVFDSIPGIQEDKDADRAYVLDKLDADGSIIDDKLVSAGTVEQLTGRRIGRMRAGAKNRLRAEIRRIEKEAA